MIQYILLTIFFIPLFVFAQYESEILEANKHYKNGNYESAIGLYQKIIDNGYESAELYYNLANSYYKFDDIAYAILYYEKAKKINPRNKDIQYNLSVVNNQKIDRLEAVPVTFWQKWWKNMMNLFPSDIWTLLSIVFLFLFFLFLSIFLYTKKISVKKLSFWLGVFVLIFFVHSFLFAYHHYYNNRNSSEAIVFATSLSVKSSPDIGSVNLFVIHEGTKVELLENLEDWTKIEIVSGGQGWVEKKDLKEI